MSHICELENLPFGHKQTFAKTQLKIFIIFLNFTLNFLHIWIKQLLNLLAVKFHTKSLFFLEDMDDYYQTDQCAKKVVFQNMVTYM